MRLVFFCNYLNHHQVAVADALYEQLKDDFWFVTTRRSSEQYMKGGDDYSTRPYCFCAELDERSRQRAEQLAIEADVALFGAESQHFAVTRAKARKDGLSFEMGERWLKRGWKNMLSPVLLRWLRNYWFYYQKRPFYKLNSSAFGAQDHYQMHTYRGRCFKWGYFTQAEADYVRREQKSALSLLWVGRFLDWKHPEMAVELADRLKNKGIPFRLDMIGDGPAKEHVKALCTQLGLEDVVTLQGSLANNAVRTAMREHDILLQTSNRYEGWGVVANEAMGCGCVLVGSDAVGAVPYLVRDGENGLIFESENVDSLADKVQLLWDKPAQREAMSLRGWETLTGLWSPRQAAANLLQLIDDLLHGRKCSLREGPCSEDLVSRG